MQGSVIRIFLKDGNPDGLRTIELTLSTVLATIFPRPSLEKFLGGKSAQKLVQVTGRKQLIPGKKRFQSQSI